jgi:hypothetical protein
MLDGRIGTQSTSKDLRAHDVLDEIAQDSITELEAKQGTESPHSLGHESDSVTSVISGARIVASAYRRAAVVYEGHAE